MKCYYVADLLALKGRVMGKFRATFPVGVGFSPALGLGASPPIPTPCGIQGSTIRRNILRRYGTHKPYHTIPTLERRGFQL
ncbi:MAG: hypothetical protein QXZ48_03640 [Zestosphaera sp.]